jgi:hypothetical protein
LLPGGNLLKKPRMPLPALDDAEETRFRISSPAELDALVGTHLAGEKPRTHWEDSRSHCQFATLEEALETMHDLFFRELVLPASSASRKPAVLTEIREFRPYSTDLNLAWEVVAQLHDGTVVIRREGVTNWSVTLGADQPVTGETVAGALCLAALQTKRIRVVFGEAGAVREEPAGSAAMQVLLTEA